jgi:hypothetical protein
MGDDDDGAEGVGRPQRLNAKCAKRRVTGMMVTDGELHHTRAEYRPGITMTSS